MKLYKREDFIKLPKDTIYSTVRCFEDQELLNGLYCKVSSPEDWSNDFSSQDLLAEGLIDDGESYCSMAHLNLINKRNAFEEFESDLDCTWRDGGFDDSDLFVVWNRRDVEKLFVYLGKILK